MTEIKTEKINILLAIYHPNKEWLAEQLKSLNEQSYQNLSLIVIDDGPDLPVGETLIASYISRFPFRYIVHEKNFGSNKTFEELVSMADGDYIAFCDQDDIWDSEKIEKLHKALKESDSVIAYCGLSAIDAQGRLLAEDIRSIRRRDAFVSGEKISDKLVIKNCIYGSSLLMRSDIAKEALPLPPQTGFDHWFTLWGAIKGKVTWVSEAMVEHRIHDTNQSKPLQGIETKEEYIEKRVVGLQVRMAAFLERFQQSDDKESFDDVIAITREALEWAKARERWLRKDKGAYAEFSKGRVLSPKAFQFERIMPLIPEKLFKSAIRLIQ